MSEGFNWKVWTTCGWRTRATYGVVLDLVFYLILKFVVVEIEVRGGRDWRSWWSRLEIVVVEIGDRGGRDWRSLVDLVAAHGRM